jgi:hypothetical protein
VEDGVAVAEGAALAVLAAEADGDASSTRVPKARASAKPQSIGAAVAERGGAGVEEAADLGLGLKSAGSVVRHWVTRASSVGGRRRSAPA